MEGPSSGIVGKKDLSAAEACEGILHCKNALLDLSENILEMSFIYLETGTFSCQCSRQFSLDKIS